jgi:hypothetical protein
MLPACGSSGDDSPEAVRADLSDELQEQLGLDDEQADCFADLLIEEVGTEELKDIDVSAAEPPEGLQREFAAASLAAVEECDIDAGALAG